MTGVKTSPRKSARQNSLKIPASDLKNPSSSATRILISATFTAIPILPGLEYWKKELKLDYIPELLDYNQVFQDILHPESRFRSNDNGLNVILLRFEDWLPYRSEKTPNFAALAFNNDDFQQLKKNLFFTLNDFISALQALHTRASSRTLLLICPNSDKYQQQEHWNQCFRELGNLLSEQIKNCSLLQVLKAEEFHTQYQIETFDDPLRNQIGHIPFTDEYYDFLSTLIIRYYHWMIRKNYKVIVLDCDNTLWSGVCGEVNPEELEVRGAFQEFQQFLVGQKNQGILLCLCSKNVAEDVWKVFQNRPDFPLKKDDFTEYRINWQFKSENLHSLANSLNLGLDSFIFIDDNPVECAEVQANCPEVLTLQWPQSEASQRKFIYHTWVFDHFSFTAEDLNRTLMMQQNIQRQSFLNECTDFTDFLQKLNLEVEILPMGPDHLARVSQLTKRTNQFNLTTIRRSEHKIRTLLEKEGYECLIANVKDRFGEYGLVGVMIFLQEGLQLTIDSFMLSCRVLGRGVEHRMMAQLGEIALERKLTHVAALFVATEKNNPVREFLENIVGQITVETKISHQDEQEIYLFDSTSLSGLHYILSSSPPGSAISTPQTEDPGKEKKSSEITLSQLAKNNIVKIAESLTSIRQISQAIRTVTTPMALPSKEPAGPIGESGKERYAKILAEVSEIFGRILKIDAKRIDPSEPLESFVRNSMKIVELTVELQKRYANISNTFLFEYSSLAEIALKITQHSDPSVSEIKAIRPEEHQKPNISLPTDENFEVAIVGINGRFPKAETIEEFWQNLANGISGISEVPNTRWDVDLYFDPTGTAANKSYSKWGGFIQDVDCFEPSFFNIAPKEAELMDPQQRIFLEVVWGLLEDACYTRENLPMDTGVFVGVISNDYSNYVNEASLHGLGSYRYTDIYQIPNRVSYFMNLHGPSIAVDTACSASGTAIHLAFESLRRGESSCAIVGGVNLFLHPSRYIQYSQMQFLAKNDQCCPFGAEASGTIFGEGICALLLKPLNKAKEDRDNIYAVIKGTAINSGGKTNGFTVPNPNAQAELVTKALNAAKVHPRTISYVEAHGTGTPLGDPIEVQGLTKAFQQNDSLFNQESEMQYCALGTVKANIGHLESGAAIVSIIKTVLQLKHKVLVPSLNSHVLNPLIPFESSPFYVPQKLLSWDKPILEDNSGQKHIFPRRAGISSFGAGGSNVHLIIEEFDGAEQSPNHNNHCIPIIILSAKDEKALKKMALNWRDFIIKNDFDQVSLSDIAYSLQIGREHFKYRLAIVANSINDLREKLGNFLDGKANSENILTGIVRNTLTQQLSFNSELDNTFLYNLFQAKEHTKIAAFWILGMKINWDCFYKGEYPRRVSLPTYPFARERYWVPAINNRLISRSGAAIAALHPLLQQNTSDLSEQRYSSIFTGQEFFLKDHVVMGQRVLPEAACLEMARAAVAEAAAENNEEGRSMIRLKNVIWTRPIAVGEESIQVYIGLYPEDNGEIAYEIYSIPQNGEAEVVVHNQGIATLAAAMEIPILDLPAIQAKCSQRILSGSEIYSGYKKIGINYGPWYQGIEKIYIGENQVLAELSLSNSIVDTQDQFVLHPAVVDAAFQAVIGLIGNFNALKFWQTFAMQELEVFNKCTPRMWALIRSNTGFKNINIDLCGDNGAVCVRLKGLEIKETINSVAIEPSRTEVKVAEEQEPYQLMMFEEVWQEEAMPETKPLKLKTILCFLSNPENQQTLTELLQTIDQQTKIIFFAQADTYQKQTPERYGICRKERDTYEKAFQSILADCSEVDAIMYLWALEDVSCIEDYSAVVYLLQAMKAAKLRAKRILLGAQFKNGLERCYLESWLGFERSLGLIMPDTTVTAVFQDTNRKAVTKDWFERLVAELQSPNAQSVLYEKVRRQTCWVREIEITTDNKLIRAGGTYLITGGCGGLGLLFAEHLAKEQPMNLILSGRSAINSEKQRKIKALEDLGSKVIYLQADVSDVSAMKDGLRQAKERFGTITGVIHAAGLNDIQNILEKDYQSFQKILEPKIQGTLALDELLQEETLDFICYFSSTSAIIGDFGGCDYAIGNRFLTAYAKYRNQEQQKGKRSGKAIVINWPLWKDGGMGIGDNENTAMYLKSSGQRMLEAEDGLRIFDRILAGEGTQYTVFSGQPSRVRRFLGLIENRLVMEIPHNPKSNGQARGRRAELKGLSIAQCLEWDLKEDISKLLKISPGKIDRDENLADFGFDSISLAEFAKLLSDYYGIEITPALFFGYSTPGKLIGYFLAEHQEAMGEFYREDMTGSIEPMKMSAPSNVSPAGIKPRRETFRSRFTIKDNSVKPLEPIAIIGMSGRFPEARNIEELWKILSSGKDVVREIPPERFDWREYYGDPEKEPGKINCKWCGCLPGVSEFDPLFFEISPREAETMDPRQRLLLQESWNALEDAGYGPEQIKAGKIGMFVGAEQGEYQALTQGEGNITSNLNGILAARLAYFLNLNGPVMAIDTACSSGLVATYQAILSLRNHECDTAIAAGVNLMLTPALFIAMSQAGMLSADGKCYVFDKRADGIVPGEAVAVVVLKRLSQAKADGDPIYAAIKGSGINYDGKTNGITAPSGVSQTSLLKAVYDQHRVNPEEIEYIVTHGTGTKLGDPIEINALYDTFKDYTKKQRYCALTSTKANFGHTFAASGLVSLINLVQAFQHGTIPASLHCEEENDYINWKESPFYVNKTNKSWPPRDGKARTGAVSAFGISGTNAHMVVESYDREDDTAQAGVFREALPYYVLAFSAKTQGALEEKLQDIIEVLENGTEQNLAKLSYTLLEGRHHFNYRCAIVAQDLEHAVYLLKQVINKEKTPNVFQGKVPREFTGQKAIEQYAQDLLKQSRSLRENRAKYQETLFALADFYCQGYRMNWGQLFGENKPERIHLPTYPFTRESYWAPETNQPKDIGSSRLSAVLHPLLQQNTSDLSEQRFSSTFTGREFFLADHVVKGRRVLPGVAYLEMARAAIDEAAGNLEGRKMIKLKNVVWTRPISVDRNPVRIHIGLYPEDNGEIAYEVYSMPETGEAEAMVYSQGSAVLAEIPEIPILDLQAIQAEYSQRVLSATEVYDFYQTIGLEYGPGHRGIEQIYAGKDGILAKLSLPASVSATVEQFVLHPSIMDSALQAVVGITNPGDGTIVFSKLSLPFALQELEIYKLCTASMWAIIRYSKGSTTADRIQKLDIELCNESGEVCVRMKGYSARILEGGISETGPSTAAGSIIFEPVWKEQAAKNGYEEITSSGFAQHLVILCEPGEVSPVNIENGLKSVRCLSLQSKQKNIEKRFEAYAIKAFTEIQTIIKEKHIGKTLVQIVSSSQEEQQLFAGLSGLLKTAQLENSRVIGQLIEIEQWVKPEEIIAKLKENITEPMDGWIRYHDGKRLVAGWNEVTVPPEVAEIPWKERGVYLITGGAGGLGMIFAKEITTQVKGAILILTGRSLLSPAKEAQLKELESVGARVIYRQVDISNRKAVNELIRGIETEFSKLDGIFHCAGVIRDNYIIKKTCEEFLEVLAPKVTGIVNLDAASQTLDLDFMILFSSTSGSLGNPGQADYATANAFMDMYAKYRNELVNSGQRQGRTLSINWPLWQEGGMQIDEAVEKMLKQSMGMIAMRTETGIRTLYAGVNFGKSQIMVIEGNLDRIKQKLFLVEAPAMVQSDKNVVISNAVTGLDTGSLQEKVQSVLMQAVSKLLKVKIENIDVAIELHEYGFDSISLTQFANILNEEYKLELNPTVFFEYPTIRSLAEYLVKEYQTVFSARFAVQVRVETFSDPVVVAVKEENLFNHQPRRSRFAGKMTLSMEKPKNGANAVAIVGMSGLFPQARDLDEFWGNLIAEKDCITEIPKDRWDWEEYYGDPYQEMNKSNIKWGGFIDGVAEFDPLFFGISPREAELMDPQQRLLMIYAWKAIEDAGYSAESLSGTKTGIFVGTANTGYERLIAQANVPIEGYSSTGSVISIGPNRMSFFLNIHGPSEPIETACSSSLVAIHRAVNAIENGNCEMAIVGGINTILTPENHISFNKAGMLSEDGHCKTFSDQANGYVRGEGVGMLFLKKLEDAEQAGDHIYGVIRGTAENHGGRANSLTAPNPKAQAELLQTAYQKAGIDPRTVTYIEAHGTGTELGDPIEINGLKAAFKELYQATGDTAILSNHCGLGSVKTNIGHLELAAGAVGVIKVLLQLKHKTLVKSLHCENINPYIQLKDSPFYIVQEQREWETLQDGQGRQIPRRAGVSSFGFGGVNAHVVIEEYIPQERQQSTTAIIDRNPAIIVLSAKNEERLKEQAQQLFVAIQTRQFSDGDLVDMAYTLQVGREAMEERLAVIVGSIKELEEKLWNYLEGRNGNIDLYRGQVKRNKETLAVLAVDEDMAKTIDAWINKKKYNKMLDLWVKGWVFDWNRLYVENKPRRISLPTYPFVREHYWVPEISGAYTGSNLINQTKIVAPIEKKVIKKIKCYLKKQWELCSTDSNNKVEDTIAILANQATRELATELSKHFAASIILNQHDLVIKMQQSEYEWGKYGGWIDLVGCGKDENKQLEWILGLQQLIELSKDKSLMLLYVTKGLESYQIKTINFSGASRVGLYRMLQSEYSHLRSRHMDTDPCSDNQELAQQIAAEFQLNSEDTEVCYRVGERYHACLKSIQEMDSQRQTVVFPEGQVLLITGGTRGLGYLFARHFISHYGVKQLVLIGRESMPSRGQWDTYIDQNNTIAHKINAIRKLEAQGIKVQVLSVSLTDEFAIQKCLHEIKNTMGPIGGVIHCAGLSDVENPAFIRKPLNGIQQVLDPKVSGLDILYQNVKHEPLQFFVLFSSVSAIIPALASGQSDYAMANTYMDYFAEANQHDCPIISIEWPNWKETGMGEVKSKVYAQTGLLGLTDEEGLKLFDEVLSKKLGPVVLPAVVNPDILDLNLLLQRRIPETPFMNNINQPKSAIINNFIKLSSSLADKTEAWLIGLFSNELKLDPSKLDPMMSFQDFGVDSIMLAQLITRMDRELKVTSIEPSVLIENSTLKNLTDHLVKNYPEALKSLFAIEELNAEAAEFIEELYPNSCTSSRNESDISEIKEIYQCKEKIAIIGMACHFPDAMSIGEYWANLRSGRDSIREVPKSRWDWQKYYDPDGYREGKSASKWGAFIEGIEDFDPGYFKIMESLAPQIDPLQRQWLETSTEALADAGYDKKSLWGKKVGVFAGTRVGNFASKVGGGGKDSIIGMGQNFIAVHLSHIYNFKGPNMVVDTACSSSLTAIHLAARCIQNGEAEVALAGGVDILLDETPFLGLSVAKILSPEGRCKTFDAQANGIGLGEGCGVLVLKPMAKAVQDNDKIYAVIDGSAINNDGNTMGVTTPNPEAQKELIEAAIMDANINPETISYIEAHGTGTLIGDPIELKSLTQIFAKYTDKKQFCKVGSVKSNIGHLLSASGAASIIKVILAMTHYEIPPTLHCNTPNPRFNFKESPFSLVRELTRWDNDYHILRAGVSAFGLGGNNAHIIVSNEGIPNKNKASLEPKGDKVVFSRRRYWPDAFMAQKQKNVQANQLTPDIHGGLTVNNGSPFINNEEEFLELFESIIVETGGDNE